jgi:hypothetical protein
MMKVRFGILAVFAAIIACLGGGTALATGSTHVWAPSTDVQAFKVWHITCDMYLPVETGASGARVPTITNLGLTVGILPFKKVNMEIGFDHKSGLGPLDDYPLYGNAKIGVPENALGGISPALAVGVFDVGTKNGATDYNVMYGKAAKTVTAGDVSLGRVSVGYFSGNEDLLVDENGEKDNQGIMAAWERTMTEVSDKMWICLEYMGTKSGYGSFNVGASWKFASNVAVLGGFEVFNNKFIDNTATIQVDIDI